MLTVATIAHVRRHHPDGATVSVCRDCFVTVITAASESDLSGAEQKKSRDSKQPDSSRQPIDHQHYDYE
jgi:ribosome-binding protein aMBF1 (putative translation factor)